MAKAIPGLRPWEVLSVEQAMDQITFGGKWYRQPLGTYTTGPPYIRSWNNDVMVGHFVCFVFFSRVPYTIAYKLISNLSSGIKP